MLFLRMLPLVLPQAIITNDFAALNLIYVWFVLDCSNPTPLNGIVSLPNGNTYGSVAMVSCNSGYKLYGDALIRCQLNSSWSSTPSCIKGKNTHTHTHIHARANTIKQRNFEQNACVDNSILSYFENCYHSNNWNTLTDCGDPSPSNGHANTTGGTLLNQTATVSCDTGYKINGSDVLICQQNGWNDTTTCIVQGKLWYSMNLFVHTNIMCQV